MWTWSPQVRFLSRCSIERNHIRNDLVLKGSSKPSILVLRALTCGPGAFRLCLSKCSKRNHRRNDLVLKGLSKPSIWVLRVLICGPGAIRFGFEANVLRDEGILKALHSAVYNQNSTVGSSKGGSHAHLEDLFVVEAILQGTHQKTLEELRLSQLTYECSHARML